MRHILAFCFSVLPILLFSQKLFQTGEWCSSNKQTVGVFPQTEDNRSDSIDLTHARVTLDLSNALAKSISGCCEWSFFTKVDHVAALTLDLLGLTVDTVLLNGETVAFTQVGEHINVVFPAALPLGSAHTMAVCYHGDPQKDASGWGGFYFDANYAFNLGVGFDADPHVFGRAWFPCFDNFTERSTYTFDITTTQWQPAYCNGAMVSDETTTDGKRRRVWQMDQSIPSYLACVAIGPYTSFSRSYSGENNVIPVEIAAAAGDTVKVRNTFQHLPDAIHAFEHWYGPYKWSKIGYSLVPFGSGAMEHATNIAIGRSFIDGTLNYETLWAHELSHHWWGDLATCSTAEDMWLNEGWASYSEHLFTEWVYGRQNFQNAVRSNFLSVLQTAHVTEGGYRAVSGIPHALTYGTHVYNKGAVVAHNLRGYLGDSLFRVGVRTALESNVFTDWSSTQFRDVMSNATGYDLTPFFENWVFSGGFTDLLIDSTLVSQTAAGEYEVTLFVKQKLRGAPTFFSKVPLEITFVREDHTRIFRMATITGEESTVQFTLDFIPKFAFLNTNLHLTLARSDGEKVLKTTGTTNFQEAKMNLVVTDLGADSVFFRVEHHFAHPDDWGANPNNYQLTSRFWQVYGDFSPDFKAQATISYDGRGQLDQLDTPLFAATGPSEDSIVLLYRPSAGLPWVPYPDYTKITLSTTTDKFGQLKLLKLKSGQYTIGKGVATLSNQAPSNGLGMSTLSPNPCVDNIQLKTVKPFDQLQLVGQDGSIMSDLSFKKNDIKRVFYCIFSGRPLLDRIERS